jgi:CHAT domain-containing protein/Flp pilus assembly protein TadD
LESASVEAKNRWLVLAFAVMIALAVLVLREVHLLPQRQILSPLFAVATHARVMLSGRIEGMPTAPTTRGFAPQLKLAAAAGAILEQTIGKNDAVSRDAAGVASLVAGDVDNAVSLLTKSVERAPVPPRNWSDLSAALIERGQHDDNPEDTAAALGAADRALQSTPNSAAARFNRALALELLHLDTAAQEAWQQYLDVDGGSPWAADARSRLDHLRRPTRMEEWRQVIPRLEAAAAATDEKSVAGIVAAFPQQARSWGETEFLNDWAMAVLHGDEALATAKLKLVHAIGAALLTTNRERLLHDVLVCIGATSKSGRASLAAAQHAFREGRLLYSQRRVAESSPLFEDAQRGFDAVRAPMSLLARYYCANVLYDEGRADDALTLVRSTLAQTPKTYGATQAQLLWTEGTILLNQGQLRQALSSYQRSLAIFQEMKESDNASTMRDNVAITLSLLGRTRDAWRLRVAGFADASASGDASRLQYSLETASRQAIRQQQWDVASSILTVALSNGSQNARQRAATLLWRAFAKWRSGESSTADLSAARSAIPLITDPALREATKIQLKLAEGMSESEHDPHAAIDALTDVISFANRKQQVTILPLALFQRAEAFRSVGDADRALADLGQSVDVIEKRRVGIAEADLRDTLLNTASRTYEHLIEVLLERGDTEAAFNASERMHSRRILEETASDPSGPEAGPMTAAEITRAVMPNTLIASYVSIDDGVVLFTVTRSGIRAFLLPTTAHAIEDLRSRLVHAIDRELSSDIAEVSASLYQVLIAPMRDELTKSDILVVVPSDATTGIPIAALSDGRSGFLVERLPIVLAPSASTYVRGLQVVHRQAVNRTLIVGAPSIDPTAYPNMEALTAAGAEARSIASLYGTRPLTGSDASVARIVAEIPQYDLIHIATHALAERSDASLSSLIFSRAGNQPGALHVNEIAALRPPRHPLLVLAGCGTGAVTTASDSVRSIALAFLVAGSRSVIGSLWNIDDDASSGFTVAIHRSLRAGFSAAGALREAQVAAIRLGGPAFREIRTWSAFQVYGTGV